MRLLTDTHALIWFAEDSQHLSHKARKALENTDNSVWYSITNIWEISIKTQLGKLRLATPLYPELHKMLSQVGLKELPVTYRHAAAVAELPPHHGDPFDRLLVAQSLEESLVLVSRDDKLDAYGMQRLW